MAKVLGFPEGALGLPAELQQRVRVDSQARSHREGDPTNQVKSMIRLHAETAGAGAAGGSGLRNGFKSLQPVDTFVGTWFAYPWFALPVKNLTLHEVAANA